MANQLKHRIATLHRRQPYLAPVDTEGAWYSAGAGPVPANVVLIEPGVGAGLTPTSPIYASDGAPIPATGPGKWDQLVAAGPHL